MKKVKTIFIASLMILTTFVISAAAQSILINSEQKNNTNPAIQNTNFDAEITFYIYEGEGCSCIPITGAYINATGSEGQVFNVTDDEGICVLNLVILSEYRVSIEAENFNTVMFNFDIVDDQTFKFHMGEANEVSSQNLLQVKQIIHALNQFLRFREGRNNIIS